MHANEPVYQQVDGRYHFYLQGDLRFTTDEVAILFDKNGYVLLKHGKPELVQAAYDRMRAAFIEGGFDEVANDLVLIQGRFDVDELNKAVGISGHMEKLYQAVQNNSLTN